MSAPSKSELRKLLARTIKNLTSTEKQNQSKVIFDKLTGHSKFNQAKRVTIYLSTENEIDTVPILDYLLTKTNKQCFIPFVWKSGASKSTGTRMIMVELKSMQEYEGLNRNKYGIKEFDQDAITAQVGGGGDDAVEKRHIAHPIECPLDLVIVPGVAFSKDGRRLGHGKGYYDEFFHCWMASQTAAGQKRLHTIGLAFREQIVDDALAVEGHDYRLDEVLTA